MVEQQYNEAIVKACNRIICVILLGVILSFCVLKDGKKELNSPKKEIVDSIKKNVVVDDNLFNDSLLMSELRNLGIKEKIIVYNQCRLETGNFGSYYFDKHNNLWGFRNKNGYMKFNSWRHCCKFMKNWQDKYYKGGDYYDFLVKIGYAEDPAYIRKLKKMANV